MLLTAVLIPLAVYLISAATPKKYEAGVTLQVQQSAVDTALFGSVAVDPSTITATTRLIETTGVAEAAARELEGPRADARSLLGKVSASSDDEAGFITITATDGSADHAAAIANAFASAVAVERAEQARNLVDQAIAALTQELETERGSVTSRRQLSDELQRLRALRAAQGSNAQVVEPATAPSSAVSPKPIRNATLGLITAVLLGLVLAFLVERLDRRVKSGHELEELTRLPLLGSIPATAFSGNGSSPADTEAFQTLRASLTYFNVEHPLKTIVVSSPLKGDGKTTVAVNLAVSVARGGKDVTLVDADLRRPRVAALLGVAPEVGLSSVLAGEATMEEALIDFHVGDGAALRVLPAGPLPPNPSKLLGSERMRLQLEELERGADMVIIDSTPILPVSDVLPLFRAASGVVAVGRINKTSRDSVRRFQEVVTMAGGSLLGIVATDTRAVGLYDGYGYGYGSGYPYGSERESEEGTARVPARGDG